MEMAQFGRLDLEIFLLSGGDQAIFEISLLGLIDRSLLVNVVH
jgi:hypothetical protein